MVTRIVFLLLLAVASAWPQAGNGGFQQHRRNESRPKAGGGGGGGIALVQSRSSGNNDSVNNATLAFTGDVTSGSIVAVGGAGWNVVAAPTFTISKSAGTATIGSVTVDAGTAPAGMVWRTFIAYVQVTGSGSLTIDVNPVNAADSFSFTIAEFSGVTQLDVDGGQTDATTANPSDSITTSSASALVLGVMSHDGADATLGAGTGWTMTGENESNTANQTHAMVHRIESSTGTFSGQFTYVNGSGVMQSCQSLSLKP